jgi:uncharacterized protein (TIGR03083 family)
MASYADAYAEALTRFGKLVSDLTDEQLEYPVPACPDWSVRDLFSHVAGVAADAVAGNIGAAGEPEWTAAHVADRRERSVAELVAELEDAGSEVEGALDALHPAIAGLFVGDVVTHEQDARGALKRPGGRDSEALLLALDTYVRFFGRRIKEHSLPALNVFSAGSAWNVGLGDPVGDLRAEPFALIRGLTGRRTASEIRGLAWSVDPDPYIEVFSMYGRPEASLGE